MTGKKRLVLATKNRGKIKEFERLLAIDSLELLSIEDALPGIAEVDEHGDTFEANASLKAREYAALCGLPTLADDSGLEVDALGGAPGVHSARYASLPGQPSDPRANLLKLIASLQDVPAPRHARFRCVLAFADGPELQLFDGRCEGSIVLEPRGSHGFGYDPVFVPQASMPAGVDRSLTMAELDASEKDALSHRGIAVRKLVPVLREWVKR